MLLLEEGRWIVNGVVQFFGVIINIFEWLTILTGIFQPDLIECGLFYRVSMMHIKF